MFQALRNRNLALLFTGQIISFAGDMMLFIVLPFWIYKLTGSATATGLMFVALTIPQLVLSPIAGVFVDRLDRKRLMIAADLIRFALMLCYLFVNSADQVWLIYLLAFAESAVSQFFRPAVTAVVPMLVEGEEELARGNALLGASVAVGQLVGPAIGGVLVTTLGPHGGTTFDAATYLISAVCITLMHVPLRKGIGERLTGVQQAVGQITRELLAGVRVVLNRPILRVVFASLALLALANGVINVLLIVVINQLWHTGATEFGWLVTAQGIGGIIGTVFIGAVAARVKPRTMIIGGGVLAGTIFALMVNQPSVYVAIGLIPILGIAVVGFDVGLTTLIQLGSDDANRGRVGGLMQTAMAAAGLVSIGLTTVLADQLGSFLLLNIAGVLFILGGLVAIFVPRLVNTPTPAPTPTPQPAD